MNDTVIDELPSVGGELPNATETPATTPADDGFGQPQQATEKDLPKVVNNNDKKQWKKEDGLEYQHHNIATFKPDEIPFDDKAFIVTGGGAIPEDALSNLDLLAMKLAQKKYKLRTDYDKRDVLGYHIVEFYPIKEVYFAWPKMVKNVEAVVSRPIAKAYSIAMWFMSRINKNFEPATYNVGNEYMKLFTARKSHMYLGPKLDSKVKFVIIYTDCGSTKFTKDTNYKNKDNRLGFDAISYATQIGAKVFNINNQESMAELEQLLV